MRQVGTGPRRVEGRDLALLVGVHELLLRHLEALLRILQPLPEPLQLCEPQPDLREGRGVSD